MEHQELIAIVRENERMRISLMNIQLYAGNAIMGAWRQNVYDMAKNGLTKPD